MNARGLWMSGGLAGVLLIGAACFLSWQAPVPVTLTLSTGQPNGTYFPLGQLVGRAIEKSNAEIRVHVVESDGSIHNMKRLADGDANLAIVQNDTAVMGAVRTLIPLHHGVLHFIVGKKSGITRLSDLRGKRVGIGPKSSGSRAVITHLLSHFGMNEDDFEADDQGLQSASELLIEAELDALLFMASVDSMAARQLVASGVVEYVSLATVEGDGNEMDGFAVTYPYVQRYTIPVSMHESTSPGSGQPSQPCVTFSLRSSLVARADLDESIARAIVEAVVHDRASMMREEQAAAEITEDFSRRDVQFPLHAGAVAFYQRQSPTFLERNAESMAFVLSSMLALFAAIAALSKWLARRKKNRIDVYYSRLDELLTELSQPEASSDRLRVIDDELMGMRQEAVRELVQERLTADESFRIFQSLLTECQRQLATQQSGRENAAG